MRAVFIGPPSHAIPGREQTYWVAVAEYVPGDKVDDVPDGPGTTGLGEYGLVDARHIADQEARRRGLSVVDLSGKPQTARA